jgi:Carboxypeptidase regulatory-like domain
MRKAIAIICLASLAMLGPKAFGQAVYGNVVGTVTDQSGAAVPNAKVTITDTQRQVAVTTTTNRDGNFTQRALIAGVYQIRVEITGFKTAVQITQNGQQLGPWGRPARGSFGSVGRNRLLGPSFQQWDMSLSKNSTSPNASELNSGPKRSTRRTASIWPTRTPAWIVQARRAASQTSSNSPRCASGSLV